MDSNTFKLKKILSKSNNVSDMINYYKGKDCYIISCGPSLNDYDLNLLKRKLKNKLVICVKQAYSVFNDICDIHISNFTNYTENNYNYKKTINIFGYLEHREADNRFLDKLDRENRVDLKFKIAPHPEYSYISILCKKEPNGLECMLKDFMYNQKAIVGPGIMYEVCFPLAIAMGVRSITTIGWDIGQPRTDKKYQHFYDKKSKFYKLKSPNKKRNINHSSLRREAKTIANASKEYNNFLKSNGIKLKILSNRCMAHLSIKRIKLFEI